MLQGCSVQSHEYRGDCEGIVLLCEGKPARNAKTKCFQMFFVDSTCRTRDSKIPLVATAKFPILRCCDDSDLSVCLVGAVQISLEGYKSLNFK